MSVLFVQVQLTDFENAAYMVFMVLLTRVILTFHLNFIIPISKVLCCLLSWCRLLTVSCAVFVFFFAVIQMSIYEILIVNIFSCLSLRVAILIIPYYQVWRPNIRHPKFSFFVYLGWLVPMALVTSTKLSFVEPGYYWWRLPAGLPSRYFPGHSAWWWPVG